MRRVPVRSLTPVQREGFRWLLAGGVAAVAPVASELPAWVSAAFLASLAWRYAIDRRGWAIPGRWLRVALAALGLGFVYLRYGSFLGRDPGVALLVWLTGTKVLEVTGERDAMLWSFLLFLVLLGGFLYEQSPLHAAYALAVVVLVVAGIVRLHEDAPAAGMARLGYAAVIVAQAVPLMLLMYLLFPRLPAPLWALPSPETAAMTGMSDEMRPGSIGRLVASEVVAFRVHFEQAHPVPADRYWRVRVLWESDGRVWRTGEVPRAHEGFTPLGEPVSYRVTLEPTGKTWLPALDLPASAPVAAALRAGSVIERRHAVNERVVYELRSHPVYRTGPLSNWERRRALAVPPTSARVHALARSWREAGGGRDAEIVRAALAHFREGSFHYTLSPPTLGDDPVDEFLFETRRGFCEHYAAAFATVMRAAGVPARVVIGYQGGLYNPTGDYYMVRQSDAHAWTEVWLAGRGWVRVDPTAAVAPERVESGIDSVALAGADDRAARARFEARWLARSWQRARFAWDYLNLSWFYWVKDYDEKRQARLLERLGLGESAGLALVLGVLGFVCAYALLAARARGAVDPLVRVYDRYCRKLARAGLARAPHEGPLDYARRAIARWPDQRHAIEAITAGYVAVRYGAGAPAETVRTLARDVRRFAPPRGT